ncbi:rhodopsin [Stylophora pistillata]|uniref:Rhodopsin n=1 Tax=Stylophora pistillata TaxID=50429 RepID=A0A2B4SNW7_STYPI|nr:rhodopsin [Stylophora pistillata]
MSDFKNKSKDMDPEEAFSTPIYYVIAAVYAVLTVTAFSLNTLVIWAFVKDRTLRTRSNRLILSIAVGDWLHAVLAYPFGVVRNASQSWRMSGGACTCNMRKITLNAHGLWGENAAPTKEAIQAESKIARMAFVMSISFLFAWTPYAVLSLYAIINKPEDITPLVATLPSLFAKTAACYNPVIYFLSYKKFRESLGQTLRRERKASAESRI